VQLAAEILPLIVSTEPSADGRVEHRFHYTQARE
jgi:hypothetical protein